MGRVFRFMVLCVVAAGAWFACADLASAALLPGAASGSHGWVFVPQDAKRAWLLHTSDDDAPGFVRHVREVTRTPAFVGASGDIVIFGFRDEDEAADGGRIWRLRTLRAQRVDGPEEYAYERGPSLPPVDGRAELIGVTRIGERWVALVDGGGIGPLMESDGSSDWTTRAGPVVAERVEWQGLGAHADGLVLVGRGDGTTVLATHPGGSAEWDVHRIGGGESEREHVVGTSGRVLAIEQQGELGAAVAAVLRGGSVPLGVIACGEEDAGVLATRSRVTGVWADAGRVRAQVLDWSGRELFPPGPIVSRAPIAPVQLEALGVVLASVIASVGVFVLQPGGRESVVVLPEGVALADPGRRMLAGVLDFLPFAWLSGLAWGESTWAVLNVMGAFDAQHGMRPLLTAAAAFAASSALSESMWGKTIGKMAMGLWVIESGGGRPGFGRSLIRSVVKVMCPPLALMSVLHPGRVESFTFGMHVVCEIEDTGESVDQ